MFLNKKNCFILGISTLAYINANSIETVELMSSSSSGKSFVLNMGKLDGVSQGDSGKFFIKTLEGEIIPLGVAESVKVKEGKSFWYMTEGITRKINKGEELLFDSYDTLNSGRRDIIIKKNHVYFDNKLSKKRYLNNKIVTGDGADLVQKQEGIVVADKIFETNITTSEDLELLEFEELSKKKTKYFDDYLESVERASVNEEKRVDTGLVKKHIERRVANSTVDGALERSNNSSYEMPIRNFSAVDTSYESTYNQQKKQSKRKDRTEIKDLKKLDDMWSSDLSDDQLKALFIRNGVLSEKRRRHELLEKVHGHELSFDYSLGMKEHYDKSDGSNRGQNYGLFLRYEYYFTSEVGHIDNMSFGVDYGQFINYYSTAAGNIKSYENTFKLALNKYLNGYPGSIGKYLVYVGGGIKVGSSEVSDNVSESELSYGLKAFPSLHTGIKYCFSPADKPDNYLNLGFGVNMRFTYERIALSANEKPSNGLESNLSINDYKVSFGLGIYF